MKAAGRREEVTGLKDTKMAVAVRPAVAPDSPGKDSVDSCSEDVAQEVVKLLELKFDTVMRKLEEMGETFAEITRRVKEVEQSVNVLEENELALERSSHKHQKQIEALMQKVDDLKNRSRWNNLRLIGVPESWAEGQLAHLFEEWLPKELGLTDMLGQIKVERAHRLGQRLSGRDKPRPVLARLLNFQHKSLLLQAYRKRRDLKLDNAPVLMFQDYSATLAAQRKEFSPVCSELVKGGIRFALTYSAILKVFHKGTTHSFEQATAARKFLATIEHGQQAEKA